MTSRSTAVVIRARPSRALIAPVIARARMTVVTVIGICQALGLSTMASSGSTEPRVKAIAEEIAACHGLVSASGSMPRVEQGPFGVALATH